MKVKLMALEFHCIYNEKVLYALTTLIVHLFVTLEMQCLGTRSLISEIFFGRPIIINKYYFQKIEMIYFVSLKNFV